MNQLLGLVILGSFLVFVHSKNLASREPIEGNDNLSYE